MTTPIDKLIADAKWQKIDEAHAYNSERYLNAETDGAALGALMCMAAEMREILECGSNAKT